ncbi:MAG: hypothetical protein Hyperionvirus3_30 [Hyperionvirus sp.]|uniref:Uncharacterized protein n=1 Tax=Hyperionvirus sp. TaxID=2487770 RepID=A0A3G5A8R0_9VIRU|nr:MAG: hypothetical protein Hyperionvirus3_30 [Hyperionvirus sp.]
MSTSTEFDVYFNETKDSPHISLVFGDCKFEIHSVNLLMKNISHTKWKEFTKSLVANKNDSLILGGDDVSVSFELRADAFFVISVRSNSLGIGSSIQFGPYDLYKNRLIDVIIKFYNLTEKYIKTDELIESHLENLEAIFPYFKWRDNTLIIYYYGKKHCNTIEFDFNKIDPKVYVENGFYQLTKILKENIDNIRDQILKNEEVGVNLPLCIDINSLSCNLRRQGDLIECLINDGLWNSMSFFCKNNDVDLHKLRSIYETIFNKLTELAPTKNF